MSRFRDGRTLARYGIVAAIVIVVGGIVVQRDFLSDDQSSGLGITEDVEVTVGEPVPDFRLLDPQGQLVSLSDFRGKTVVLNFWATWCPPCRAEMPDLQAAFEERQERDDLVVVAVDLEESSSDVLGFVDEFGVTFPVALDSTGEVSAHFGVLGLPATFFIDSQGVLRHQSLGPVFGNLLPDGIARADEHFVAQ